MKFKSNVCDFYFMSVSFKAVGKKKKKTQFLFQPSIFNTRTCTFDLIEITWTGLIHCARQIYTLHRHNSHFPSPL